MKIKEKYMLGLRWSGLDKNKEDVCSLSGACFFGPVVKDAVIKDNDSIVIDFTPQYSKVISKYYFVTLRWGSVNIAREKIYLRDVYLTGEYVSKISNIDKTDYILMDTEDHEEDVHMFNLVYRGCVLNNEGKVLEI